MAHIPVLLDEVIENLNIQDGDVVLDGTIGSGGHSLEIYKRICRHSLENISIEKCGRLIGIDQDSDALLRAKKLLSGLLRECNCEFSLMRDNFRNLDRVLNLLGIAEIDKALFDLGMSSNQLEESSRGFSFLRDEPLLMTFSTSLGEEDITAREIVNEWSEDSIADIIFGYGEEKYARRIANGIIKSRSAYEINTTSQLVNIIKNNVPPWYSHVSRRTHFATKTFQALRVAVNDEVRSASDGIDKALGYLEKHGRVAVITFDSITDRMVKLLFRKKKDSGGFNILTKKPIVPSIEEIRINPRARSAKLRVCEKL